MRTATPKQYAAAVARVRGAQVRRMSTKRSFDQFHNDRGTEFASKHEVLKRGKVVSVSYYVHPNYLVEDADNG